MPCCVNLRVSFINRESRTFVTRIVSGGQTGVDRAALDTARKFRIETGGYVPNGRSAEDGRIPDYYENLIETSSSDPAVRTWLNVVDSDATLIISRGRLNGGSLLASIAARTENQPWLHVDLLKMTRESAVKSTRRWLAGIDCGTLNIAGPRQSEDPEIYERTIRVLELVLADKRRDPVRPRPFTNK